MQSGKFNVCVDGQFGSTGKGLVSSFLGFKYKPEIISTTNLPNAGHTAVNENGDKFISKIIPTASILHKWYDYNQQIFIGPTAGFFLDRLLQEIDECNLPRDLMHIHPRAMIMTEAHKNQEAQDVGGTKHIASTMQGCGAAQCEKIMRGPKVKLAKDITEIQDMVCTPYMPEYLTEMLNSGITMLHEGSQGFSLDINHGAVYPHCTSRQTTATQCLADMGLPARMLGEVYMVIRPFPIRVGNVVEDNVTKGYSGDWYPDQHEITWEEVAKSSNTPEELSIRELTTVTLRVRRVASYSSIQIRRAAAVNGATQIILNFANYIDHSCYGTNDPAALSTKVYDFIKKVEDDAQVPVTMVGTGPQINHVCCLN